MKCHPIRGLLLGCLPLFAATVFSAETNTESAAPLPDNFAELARSERRVPFRDVIRATTHCRVLSFQTNNPAHIELRKKILEAAALAGERAAREGLQVDRANEAGTHIEPFVRAALKDIGLDARIPVNAAGEAQAAGYPDVEITGAVPCYLELKTYNAATAHTTQRTFYYSPSSQPKVTRDALHFLLAFQMEKLTRDGKTTFVPIRWKLLTLENLHVHLKCEFNESNRGLYGPESSSLLAEGEVK